jgi:porphobilinogen deaminase/uroporphyrinogen-III synthase
LPATTKPQITLASRDSLLALAQTIETARRLESVGFAPKIICLKTSGDIKLDAPLYQVAGELPQKEGRAFFTKELDEALLAGRADVAVHSFKDLPLGNIPGISEPILFSEVSGADVLVCNSRPADKNGVGLIIGTSSLRRIHQLGLALSGAQTRMLRGNIVTRLEKLRGGAEGMNAILIAAAGLFRLRTFATVPTENYAHFLEIPVLSKITADLAKFTQVLPENTGLLEFPEHVFPTAPGQGVLALQMSAKLSPEHQENIRAAFTEHESIQLRVGAERRVMDLLETGCHAPLGVSVRPTGYNGAREISVCFGTNASTQPVTFSKSVFLRRLETAGAEAVVAEIKEPIARAFLWGKERHLALREGLEITQIRAMETSQLAQDSAPNLELYEAVFVASTEAIDWLKSHANILGKRIYCAGPATADAIAREFPGTSPVRTLYRGFATVLPVMAAQTSGKILWLGSVQGENRARNAGAKYTRVDYLPVYSIAAIKAGVILKQYPELAQPTAFGSAIHLVTSWTAARTFVDALREIKPESLKISCFGESAAELFASESLPLYHVSRALTFTQYLDEICGNVKPMQQNFKLIYTQENR